MLKIFLVEDEFVVREGIKNNIDWKAHGYEFTGEASDGELAFPMIQKLRPDIVITDIRMPFMDGLDASRTIREMDRKDAGLVPIIAMTADAFEEDIEHCHEAGMQEHITKPINPDNLYKVLSKCIYDAEQTKLKNSSNSGS